VSPLSPPTYHPDLITRPSSSSRAFAPTHRIALLSRSQATLDKTASTLLSSAEYKTFTADSSITSSLDIAWGEIKKAWPDSDVNVAVFNAPTTFKPGKFLDKSVDDLKDTLNGGV
jgi:short-subunit dehydrogenase